MASLREVRLDVDNRLKKISNSGRLLDEIGLNLLRVTGLRIFEQGIKSEGGKIVGSYSTEPLYVPVRASSKLGAPIGKTGKSKFKSGKKHKTRYIKSGYKGLKSKVGRPLPLDLTGQMKASYSSARNEKVLVLGFENTQRKTFASGVRKNEDLSNDKLRVTLEERYGVFTALSKEEEKLIDKVVEDFINRIN